MAGRCHEHKERRNQWASLRHACRRAQARCVRRRARQVVVTPAERGLNRSAVAKSVGWLCGSPRESPGGQWSEMPPLCQV